MFNSEIEELHPYTAMKSADCYHIIEEINPSEGVILYRAKYIKPEPKDVSGNIVIIKVFTDKRIMENVICLTRDIEHSMHSEHKNVTKIYCSFMEKGNLWIIMKNDHVTSLANLVANKFSCGLPEPTLRFVLKEVLEGLDYMHQRKWMHKNLDLEHIFVDNGDVIRVDFDSLAYDPEGKSELSASGEFPVLPPPEMLSNDGLELKSDIWCFGIVALKLAIGRIPARSYEELFEFLADWPEKLEEVKERKKGPWWARGFGCFYERLPAEDEGEKKVNNVSPAFAKMVRECLRRKTSKRPSTSELLESDFFGIGLPRAALDLNS